MNVHLTYSTNDLVSTYSFWLFFRMKCRPNSMLSFFRDPWRWSDSCEVMIYEVIYFPLFAMHIKTVIRLRIRLTLW
jgi:hypothetical protein